MSTLTEAAAVSATASAHSFIERVAKFSREKIDPEGVNQLGDVAATMQGLLDELEQLRDQGATALDAAGEAFEDMKRQLAEVTAALDEARDAAVMATNHADEWEKRADGYGAACEEQERIAADAQAEAEQFRVSFAKDQAELASMRIDLEQAAKVMADLQKQLAEAQESNQIYRHKADEAIDRAEKAEAALTEAQANLTRADLTVAEALGSVEAMRGGLAGARDLLGESSDNSTKAWRIMESLLDSTQSHGYRSPEAVEALLLKGMERVKSAQRERILNNIGPGVGVALLDLVTGIDLSALVAEVLKEGQPS